MFNNKRIKMLEDKINRMEIALAKGNEVLSDLLDEAEGFTSDISTLRENLDNLATDVNGVRKVSQRENMNLENVVNMLIDYLNLSVVLSERKLVKREAKK